VKSLTVLSLAILADCQAACGIHDPFDCQTVETRIESEGEGFLTLTLPQLLKELDESLSLEQFGSSMWLGFKRRGGLPLFLGGFLSQIFDSSGKMLPITRDTCIAVKYLRQYLASFGKVKELCSEDKCDQALVDYINTDEEMRQLKVPSVVMDDVRKTFYTLYKKGIREIEAAIEDFLLVPTHSNGSVADSVKANARWRLETWHDRLEPVFPYFHYAVSGTSFIDGEHTRTRFLNPGEEHPVKVVFVPKTAKAPRVIAMEPTCMQFMQHGLMTALVARIPKDSFGMVLFKDQTQNQELAKLGAAWMPGQHGEELATLDLSEASDRVALSVVTGLTRNFPVFREAILACRSQYAKLPDGSMRRLWKFASMGSALCFPVEAMVFSAIVITAILQYRGWSLSRQNIKLLVGEVSVYGDDIIIPADCVSWVTELLEAFGLKVNYNKSFWTGRFRESCGKEYFAWWDVTPTRVRTRTPGTLGDAEAFLSTVSTRNQFFADGGFPTTVEYLDSVLDGLYELPQVPLEAPMLGKWSWFGYEGTVRWNTNLHRHEIKTLRVVPRKNRDELNGGPALLKFFSTRGEEPLAADAFAFAGRARSVSLKTCWAAC
jgi:hypothetical protein